MIKDLIKKFLRKRIDYLYHHKQFWLFMAENYVEYENKEEYCRIYCARNDLKVPANNCFLCEDVILNTPFYKRHLECHLRCKGKWNTKGEDKIHCYWITSLYIKWTREFDSEKRKELAIKIANCANK